MEGSIDSKIPKEKIKIQVTSLCGINVRKGLTAAGLAGLPSDVEFTDSY